MKTFLKVLGCFVIATLAVFFDAWCLQLIYRSITPLFKEFTVILPSLSYGAFVLIQLVMDFFMSIINSKRGKKKGIELYSVEGMSSVIAQAVVMLIFAGCAVWASSIVFA